MTKSHNTKWDYINFKISQLLSHLRSLSRVTCMCINIYLYKHINFYNSQKKNETHIKDAFTQNCRETYLNSPIRMILLSLYLNYCFFHRYEFFLLTLITLIRSCLPGICDNFWWIFPYPENNTCLKILQFYLSNNIFMHKFIRVSFLYRPFSHSFLFPYVICIFQIDVLCLPSWIIS